MTSDNNKSSAAIRRMSYSRNQKHANGKVHVNATMQGKGKTKQPYFHMCCFYMGKILVAQARATRGAYPQVAVSREITQRPTVIYMTTRKSPPRRLAHRSGSSCTHTTTHLWKRDQNSYFTMARTEYIIVRENTMCGGCLLCKEMKRWHRCVC